MDETPAPIESAAVPPGADRRRTRRRGVGRVPDLARRGRTTMRHFILLLLGGYAAWVDERRSRGARGLIFRMHLATAWICRRFIDPEIAAMPFPAQLRRRLEILGPTYIKLGQVLSLRLDVLPEVVTAELRGLLSDLPPVPVEAITTVIETDLRRPVGEIFAEFEPECMGSASIAQSHRAVTHDGRTVIVKVVKPGIRELLYRDTDLLQIVGVVLELVVHKYQPRKVIDEFCDYTLREIDMMREAENAETFRNNFQDMPDIVFPEIYHELSGSQVLCMEYLEGVEPSADLVDTLSVDDRRYLVDLGATAIIRMLYEDGFFHADLHPGNLLLLPENKIGFIDLGMVGQLDPGLRHSLLNLFYSLVVENFDAAARHLSEVSQADVGADVPGFRRAVKELFRKWRRDASFEEFSLALMILEATRLGARYGLYFPVEMVLMVKALVTYEGVGYLLDQEFNVAEVSARQMKRIYRQQLSPRQLLRNIQLMAPEVVDAVGRLPALVSETTRFLEQRTRREPESPLRGIRATIFGGFCLLSGSLLAAFGGPWPVWVALLVLGILLPLRRGN